MLCTNRSAALAPRHTRAPLCPSSLLILPTPLRTHSSLASLTRALHSQHLAPYRSGLRTTHTTLVVNPREAPLVRSSHTQRTQRRRAAEGCARATLSASASKVCARRVPLYCHYSSSLLSASRAGHTCSAGLEAENLLLPLLLSLLPHYPHHTACLWTAPRSCVRSQWSDASLTQKGMPLAPASLCRADCPSSYLLPSTYYPLLLLPPHSS